MARDEFSARVRDALAKRVSHRCANPKCQKSTTGPHADPDKFINIGVAAHITAAAPGGPRYDGSLSPGERSSSDNAIWLCQNCAKLVDSDSKTYSREVLMRWKVEAELRARREIAGDFEEQDYFPQPIGAVHAPIPRIGGLPYDEARQLLLKAGWQPHLQHWLKGEEFDMKYGNGLYFWERGFHEIRLAMGTGRSHCTFGFIDVYGNKLVIVTAGEVFEDAGVRIIPGVWSWYLDKD